MLPFYNNNCFKDIVPYLELCYNIFNNIFTNDFIPVFAVFCYVPNFTPWYTGLMTQTLLCKRKGTDMYKSASDINNIIIKNSFDTADIEQLITQCNYEPFYDEPDSVELIQLAAYDKKQLNNDTALTNSLIGFISCIVPEFLYESYDNDMDCHEDDTIEIEITAIVSPEYRKQGIFTELFLALKQYISKQCTLKHIELPDITYIAANMRKQEGLKEA